MSGANNSKTRNRKGRRSKTPAKQYTYWQMNLSGIYTNWHWKKATQLPMTQKKKHCMNYARPAKSCAT